MVRENQVNHTPLPLLDPVMADPAPTLHHASVVSDQAIASIEVRTDRSRLAGAIRARDMALDRATLPQLHVECPGSRAREIRRVEFGTEERRDAPRRDANEERTVLANRQLVVAVLVGRRREFATRTKVRVGQ